MLTKKEAALAIIGDFCHRNRIEPEDLTDDHIHMESKLAVAMEYLQLIKSDEAKGYASSRGGSLDSVALYYFTDSGIKTLDFREIFNLLPDDKQEEVDWKDIKTKDGGIIRWRDIK